MKSQKKKKKKKTQQKTKKNPKSFATCTSYRFWIPCHVIRTFFCNFDQTCSKDDDHYNGC